MRLLVVDDEKAQRESLAGFLKKIGHDVALADSAQQALNVLLRKPMDVVLTDYKMPYMTGTDLLKELKHRYPTVVVIIMTAFGTVDRAVEAMKTGAWDFLTKPVNLDQLEAQLNDIEKYLTQKRKPLSTNDLDGLDVGDEKAVIFQDESMQAILTKVRKVADSQATVLITGETGSGKEVIAREIHRLSSRSRRPMVTVNCAALPSNLVESELFGHEKGAFTGATATRTGRFEEANGTSLFLDEVGDLPLDIQVKLLRFLQEGEYTRVGSNTVRKADVRVIAATNVDLKQAVEKGEFREDLFYRLNVIHFHIPPLRERKQDILPLARHFLRDFSGREHRGQMNLTQDAESALLNYPFPGNVRELRNMIERAVLFASGNTIGPDDLDLQPTETPWPIDSTLTDSVMHLERKMIGETLALCDGNQSECARRLGISERVLRYKLQKYKLR